MNTKPILTLSSFKKKSLDIPAAVAKKIVQVKDQVLPEKKHILKGKEPDELIKAPTPKALKKAFISKEAYLEILKYLQMNYPKCFSIESPLPLAVGIHKQLLALEDLPFSKGKLRIAIKRYTQSKLYRSKITLGSDRVDLNGEITSKVLEQEITSSPWPKIAKQE